MKVNEIAIPVGFHIDSGFCECGAQLVEVDRLEGLPVYECSKHCYMKAQHGQQATIRKKSTVSGQPRTDQSQGDAGV